MQAKVIRVSGAFVRASIVMIPVILSVSQVHGFAERESEGDELDFLPPPVYGRTHELSFDCLLVKGQVLQARVGCPSLLLTAFDIHQILASWYDR